MVGESVFPAASRRLDRVAARLGAQHPALWTSSYLRRARITDALCALLAGLLAFELRFVEHGHQPGLYLGISFGLPLIWVLAVALAGGYDSRFIGVGSDEFRRMLNAGVCLTAAVGFFAYAADVHLARGYVVMALPSVTLFDLLARYGLRKRLHKLRARGGCMRKAVVVGHAAVAADLTEALRRDSYHGLSVVAACLAGPDIPRLVAGVPAFGGLSRVTEVVALTGADTVAVLACPEMSGVRLRELAWELEKSGTDLCVAPALLDVAGPRTTIRPVAGLPLLHMDHPEFSGARRVIKEVFDRVGALVGLVVAVPVFVVAGVAVWVCDGRPVLFRQTRVGKDGRGFTVLKFRTMVADAEERLADLAGVDEGAGVLFKVRADPRVTRVGWWLRRWSVDELPQLVNVVVGDMSLVGPRPALPGEAARYGDHVRRRLAVKPGLTGLWQVSGRSNLSWDESVRLDLRYVENWSFVLDLQILWKTCAAVIRGSGAY